MKKFILALVAIGSINVYATEALKFENMSSAERGEYIAQLEKDQERMEKEILWILERREQVGVEISETRELLKRICEVDNKFAAYEQVEEKDCSIYDK